ncbi:hypothetical protein ROZALSC1DRAFT_29389 [Rozella allomycis CSF55]|uniref:Tetratricopeptide-like helical domain-containing protein n=1 Tax=Rozella allomycis (strain CSF55) TaxID=988480 RepID=A0A4P9YJF4_ROZAC|nr:hypothetical protein ROZALSC1DRAFT_29389 [Rozella allomycis CSF55]
MSSDADESNDEFQDAVETELSSTLSSPIYVNTFEADWSLTELAILQVEECVKLFLNSRFNEGEEILEKNFANSLFHSIGYSVILFIKSLMTFDPKDIQKALQVMKNTVDQAENERYKGGFIGGLTRQVMGQSVHNMKKMSTMQRHAELIHSEIFIVRAMLTLLADDGNGLMTFVKEGVNIRNSYFTYKASNELLSLAKSKGLIEQFDIHFISGVSFGLGMFNVMLSLLPSKVLKIFEIIGFSGDRKYGLSLLESASEKGGLRAEFCSLGLLLFHTVIGPHLQLHDYDLNTAQAILNKSLTLYPNSSLFLFFSGRLSFSKGCFKHAKREYEKSIASQSEWIQLHHICYWEMAVCSFHELEFSEAEKYFALLVRDNKWSKASYTYFLAISKYMQNDSGQMDKIKELMGSIANLTRKIAGKSIPIEKFVARKARTFSAQCNRLFFPVFEFLVLWNGFSRMSQEKLQQCWDMINNEITSGVQLTYDDICLSVLVKAIIARFIKTPQEDAGKLFQQFFDQESAIKFDHWMAPVAHMEFAKFCMSKGQFELAAEHLKLAKKNYKHYSLENSILIKIHNCKNKLFALSDKNQFAENDGNED